MMKSLLGLDIQTLFWLLNNGVLWRSCLGLTLFFLRTTMQLMTKIKNLHLAFRISALILQSPNESFQKMSSDSQGLLHKKAMKPSLTCGMEFNGVERKLNIFIHQLVGWLLQTAPPLLQVSVSNSTVRTYHCALYSRLVQKWEWLFFFH